MLLKKSDLNSNVSPEIASRTHNRKNIPHKTQNFQHIKDLLPYKSLWSLPHWRLSLSAQVNLSVFPLFSRDFDFPSHRFSLIPRSYAWNCFKWINLMEKIYKTCILVFRFSNGYRRKVDNVPETEPERPWIKRIVDSECCWAIF